MGRGCVVWGFLVGGDMCVFFMSFFLLFLCFLFCVFFFVAGFLFVLGDLKKKHWCFYYCFRFLSWFFGVLIAVVLDVSEIWL